MISDVPTIQVDSPKGKRGGNVRHAKHLGQFQSLLIGATKEVSLAMVVNTEGLLLHYWIACLFNEELILGD